MTVVDVDSHFHEPVDWLSTVAPELAALLPPPKGVMDTFAAVLRSGAELNLGRSRTIPHDLHLDDPLDMFVPEFKAFNTKFNDYQPARYEHPSADDATYDGAARSALCDQLGIDVQFMNPTFAASTFVGAAEIGRLDLVQPMLAAWNTFAATQVADHSDRLAPVTQTDLGDVDWTIGEMTRMRAAGSRAFNLNQQLARSLTHPDFEPLWSAAEDLGMAAYVHVGFSREASANSCWARNGRDLTTFARLNDSVFSQEYPMSVMMFVAAMVFDGVFERHPALSLIIAECGHTWVPGLMHNIDKALNRQSPSEDAVVPSYRLPLAPSDYVRRQVRVAPLPGFCAVPGFVSEPLAATFARLPADDVLVFSTDYPHLEGRANAREVFAGMLPEDERLRERFFGGSVADLLTIPAHAS